VVAEVEETLSVSKQALQHSDMERCNLKNLKSVEVKEQYQVRISNRSAALENLDYDDDDASSWERTGENIKD